MNRYLRGIRLLRDEVPSFDKYPYSIPAIRQLDELDFDANVTFLIGDNGAGKSTSQKPHCHHSASSRC